MIETKDITKMVAHVIRRDKGIADPQLMHPTREWFTGLAIATLIVLFGSWFCFYTYTLYTKTINTELPVSESSVPYQAATIAEAVRIYEAKQLNFLEITGRSSAEGIGEIGTTTSVVAPAVLPVAVNAEPMPMPEEEPAVTDDEVPVTPVLAP